MHRHPRFSGQGNAALLASLFACAAIACSTDVGNVFGNEHGGEAQGGEGPQGASGSGANGTGAGASGAGGNGGTTNQTTTSQGGSIDTTTTTDTTTTDTSTVTGLPEGTTVDCAGGQCSVEEGGVCCYDLQADSSECLESAEGCASPIGSPHVAIACQLPSDCDDGICCAHRALPAGDSPYDRTECVAQCSYPNLHLCDFNAPDCPIYDTPGGPVQSICKQSQLLPDGYYVCGLSN